MLIAHLPAGYILTKKLREKFNTKNFLILGLIASILPDLDMSYFYLIDHGQKLHHGYWIHIPFYWLTIALFTFLAVYLFNKKSYIIPAVIFFSNILVHLCLDTIGGKIKWFYPFSNTGFSFFEIPAITDYHWVLNFVFHWTFLFEVAIAIWAIILFFKR